MIVEIVTTGSELLLGQVINTNVAYMSARLNELGFDVCPYCTVCNNDLFFSYRNENATTNRHSAVIKL